MKVVIDVEANSLNNPSKIWCIVCRCVDTGKLFIFRRVTDEKEEAQRFLAFAQGVKLWIGHNVLGYDYPVLRDLLGFNPMVDCFLDTLIVSKLVDYSRKGGHSIEQYGEEFGLKKIKFNDFKQWSEELERYCIRDVEICHRIWNLYRRVIDDNNWKSAIDLEHRFQLVVNDLHSNGFAFDVDRGRHLLASVTEQLEGLDKQILEAFPPREVLIREFTPKLTKFGTIHKASVPRSLHTEIHKYEAGKTYRHTKLEPFNPSSHKQLIGVLNDARWKPEERTQTHIDVERQINSAKRNSISADDLRLLSEKLLLLKVTGWKINEHNLGTLPASAPEPARLLAKRILLESRRRTLTEWLGLVEADGRIRGHFIGLGAWTHRMAHQRPNTANIPNAVKVSDGSITLLGRELRELWIAPKGRLLVGVDAEAIQYRIFAHMIDDPSLTNAIVNGKKADKTDPHSVNQVVFGHMCKTRNAAKHSMYALFFGGRANKIAQIMKCSKAEAEEAIKNLLKKYPGLDRLEKKVFPEDAKRGYFIGIDGRQVKIPDETLSGRKHLCMSGYLQNGEKIVMARAAIITDDLLQEEKALRKWLLVAMVHDALDSEVENMEIALKVAKIKADAIKAAGEYYKLKCPMAGSYWNDDEQRHTIGSNWYVTH